MHLNRIVFFSSRCEKFKCHLRVALCTNSGTYPLPMNDRFIGINKSLRMYESYCMHLSKSLFFFNCNS